ncbi:hypothetical protein FHS37_003303 [Streptomyces griseostramineus]|uniref:Uncharacterized protein n=1 Tax=Streptomyces griseomycini TaxID=66895 RepID=A0A7W7LZ98_9ACTN|nr:hypothetical protein [Streptomyces griseomycini]
MLAIFRFHADDEVEFDVGLRELQGQDRLDVFRGFLRETERLRHACGSSLVLPGSRQRVGAIPRAAARPPRVGRGSLPGRRDRAVVGGCGECLGEQGDHGARRIGRVPWPAGADVQHADVPAVVGEQAWGHAVLGAEGTQHLLKTR